MPVPVSLSSSTSGTSCCRRSQKGNRLPLGIRSERWLDMVSCATVVSISSSTSSTSFSFLCVHPLVVLVSSSSSTSSTRRVFLVNQKREKGRQFPLRGAVKPCQPPVSPALLALQAGLMASPPASTKQTASRRPCHRVGCPPLLCPLVS